MEAIEALLNKKLFSLTSPVSDRRRNYLSLGKTSVPTCFWAM